MGLDITLERSLVIFILASGVLAVYKLTLRGIRVTKMALTGLRIKSAEKLIDSLYTDDINPFYISLHYREEQKISGEEYTYGEVVVSSFAELLRIVQPKPHEIFYDLGCGAGRAVFAAALCYPFLKVKGVELLPPLFEACRSLKNRFLQLTRQHPLFKKAVYDIDFLQGDLLKKDFSDGNIFFLNATCFRDQDWEKLQKKLSRLSVGTRLIVITRQLEIEGVDLIGSGTYPMSWGPSSAYVYETRSRIPSS